MTIEHIYRYYMSGAGNLFTVIDNRMYNLSTQQLQDIAHKLCSLNNGETTDGLIAMKRHPTMVFEADYINPDGSFGSMCGNGSRCAVLFAVQHFLTVEDSIPMSGSFPFMMAGNIYQSEFSLNGESVKVQFPIITDYNPALILQTFDTNLQCSYVFNGSDHCIVDAKHLGLDISTFNTFNLVSFAKPIRYHEAFGNKGVNVNLALMHDNQLHIRTYERGVEQETGACGTGALATAFCFHTLHSIPFPILVSPKSGDQVIIGSYQSDYELYLQGPAKFLDEQEILKHSMISYRKQS